MIENKIRRNTYNLVLPAATMLFFKRSLPAPG